MSAALAKLVGLARVAMGDASAALAAGDTPRQWERAMERAITTAHTAAYITATTQRLGTSADAALISRHRLSHAERRDITQAVAAQIAYLRPFADAVRAGTLSPAAIAARAKLYGGSIAPFYYAQRWGGWVIPERLLPGNQRCLTNCRCSVRVEDGGDGTGTLVRTLGATEEHCPDCAGLAGEHAVRRIERKAA